VKPYYRDDQVTLWHGDALEVLRKLPGASVDCIVTSPPYYGLRDYDVAATQWPEISYAPMPGMPEHTVPAMTCPLGMEADPAAYIGHLALIFAEARRVLAEDGTFWLNLGDSYAAKARGNDAGWAKSRLTNPGRVQKAQAASMRKTGERHRGKEAGIAEKNLLGIPWRAAFALQAAGWVLRSDVIWAKPNCMPESVTDRPASRHEHVFLFAKNTRYSFDLDAIREPHSEATLTRATPGRAAPGKSRREGLGVPPGNRPHTARLDQINHPHGRNPGNVWWIPTQPFSEAHFAVMPLGLAEQCVAASRRPSGGGWSSMCFPGRGPRAWPQRGMGCATSASTPPRRSWTSPCAPAWPKPGSSRT